MHGLGWFKMNLFKSNTDIDTQNRYKAEKHFSKAMSRAFKEELNSWITRKSSKLLPFEAVKEKLELWFVKDIGIHSVPLDAIIGSQGRYKSFTRHFLPLEESSRERWKEIENAISSGKILPPVELYKVCNAYFVKDGHHRISVAKSRNTSTIDARVFEYNCDVSLDNSTDIYMLAILETYHKFLKETGLKKRNPDLHLTRLGGYNIIMEHIQRHAFFLAKNKKREISLEEAAASWFDNIYTPMAEMIHKNKIMNAFPHRTETDFYIWIVKYKNKMVSENILKEDAESMVNEYSRKFSNPFRQLIGRAKKFMGIVKY